MKRFLLFLSAVLVAITAGAYDFTEITIGDEYTTAASGTDYYCYTAESNGTFTITIASAATVAIYTDENLEEQVYTRADGGINWDCTYDMTANTTYYISITVKSTKTDLTYTFSFTAVWTANNANLTFDPADGEELTELTAITVGYKGENITTNFMAFSYDDIEVYKDGEKQTMKFSNKNFDDDGTSVTVTLPTAITDEGTYTIIFPSHTFIIITNIGSSGENVPIDEEIHLTYTVKQVAVSQYEFTEITIGDEYTTTAGETDYYCYTAESDGTFTITIAAAATVAIYTDENLEEQVYTKNNGGINWDCTYDMTAGTTYYFTITPMSTKTDLTYTFSFTAVWTANNANLTFDPADGEELTELTAITVGYKGENITTNFMAFSYDDIEVYKDGEKQTMKFSNTNFADDGTSVTVTLPTAITDEGTYTIIFPSHTFIIITNIGSSGENVPIDEEIHLTYYIGDYEQGDDDTEYGSDDDDDDDDDENVDEDEDEDEDDDTGDYDGISAVTVNAAPAAIYTISGQRVKAATAKGIYIIDGRTTIVK